MDNLSDAGYTVEEFIGYAFSQFLMKAVENPAERLRLIMTVRREVACQEPQQASTGKNNITSDKNEDEEEEDDEEEEIKGFFSLVKRIWQREGVMGAFRGVLTDACFSSLCYVNEILAELQMNVIIEAIFQAHGSGELTPLQEMLLNVMHSAVVLVLTSPTTSIRETVLTNMHADIKSSTASADDATLRAPRHRYTGPFDCMRQLYRASGRSVLGAFYRGFVVGTASMMVYSGFHFTAYSILSANMDPDTMNRLQVPLAFGLTILAGVLTQPFEVVRRRLMLNAAVEKNSEIAAAANEPHPRRYSGILDCCKTIRRENGWLGFFDGLGTRTGFSCCMLVVRVLYISQ